MKRRDFFKAVTGFIAGVLAAFASKAKAGPSGFDFTPSRYMPCIGKYGKLTDNWQIDNGEWHHVVLGDNGKDKPIVVYLNGKRIR